MKRIDIGSSGLCASAIGIGCMRITDMNVKELAVLVDKALSLDIDLFDHADIYGGGEAERLFGRLFAETPSLRGKMVLQSKCGIRDGWYDLSKEHIMQSTEGILKRLGTDYLDLLMLHRPDTLMEPEQIAEAFDELYTSGKVRRFGVSNMNPAQIELLQTYVGKRLIVNQLQFSAAHSGMVDSGIHVNVPDEMGSSRDGSVLEYCRTKRITIQTWSSLQYGFFAGTFLNNEKYPALNAVLTELALKYECTEAAVAIAWILRHPAGMQAIVGSTNPKRIEEIAAAGRITLERKEWYDIYKAAGNQLP
jgi:predicted oxidoreductase